MKAKDIQNSYDDLQHQTLEQPQNEVGTLENTFIIKNKLQRQQNDINQMLISNLSHFWTSKNMQVNINYQHLFENYRELYKQIYFQIETYKQTLKKLSHELNKLQILQIRNQVSQKRSSVFEILSKSKKRKRRAANQIVKNQKCPYESCGKQYGCDISLNLHIKLKHNGGNKSDRQKLAMKICEAEISQTLVPKMQFDLPPGYLQVSFRKQFLGASKLALFLP